MTENPLLALLERAHPGRSRDELLRLIDETPDREPQKSPQRPAQRRCGSRPRTTASMERRRSWAASGRMPVKLACRFSVAEQAVLSVIAAEVVKHKACTLTVGHIAAVAGVSETTVRNAIREAKALGLVTVEERRRTAWMSYPNTVRIVSPEWASWLRLHGCKSVNPTPKDSRKEDRTRSVTNRFRGFQNGETAQAPAQSHRELAGGLRRRRRRAP